MIKILNIKLVIFLELSKYKDIFAKVNLPNWAEEALVIKKV